MTTHTAASRNRPPLRVWPGVAIAIVVVLLRFAATVLPDARLFGLPLLMAGILGGVLGTLAILVWWLLFSRVPWFERAGALVLMAAAFAATSRLVHPSIAGGHMGMTLPFYATPVLGLALVAWAVFARRLAAAPRRVALLLAAALASLPFTLLRTDGITGDGLSQLRWRWTSTAEARLIGAGDLLPAAPAAGALPAPAPAAAASEAPAPNVPVPPPAAAAEMGPWPGFRGGERDGVVPGVRIATDWSQHPPVELWRREVGPGWSSFAVTGGLLYTQEQRGDDEVITAYRVASGEPVWRHRDPVRFWESNAGAGPRATPALGNGRVYALGATGLLNALDATSGAALWSRDVAAETERRVPDWGFTASPLLAGDLVVVAASGTLAAYDAATGEPRWRGPSYGGSYSSPHRATIHGVDQIVLLGGPGALAVAPADGALLWEYAWAPGAIVQPALTADGDLLVNALASTGGTGMRRLALAPGPGGWTIEERWTSIGLKPYFNDFVVHRGHAYGFDGNILSCIDLADGARKWKGGRYGSGQLILLADQDLLLVVSEDGELALVTATPDGFRELARFPALDGKTWNHPALAGDVLLVRNSEEMAAFRVILAGG